MHIISFQGEERVPEIMDFIANQVAFRKKAKQIPVFVVYDIDPEEVDETTSSLPNTSPVLYLFFTKSGIFESARIAGDREVIDCQCNDVILALLTYISCFFVFDVGFPSEFNQFLGFLQQSLLMVPYQDKKSNGFKELMSSFDNAMEKIAEGAMFKKFCIN